MSFDFCELEKYNDGFETRIRRSGLSQARPYEIMLKLASQGQHDKAAKRLAIVVGEVVSVDDTFYKVPLRVALTEGVIPSIVSIFADGAMEGTEKGSPKLAIQEFVTYQAYLRLLAPQPGGGAYHIQEQLENAERAGALA